MTTSRRSLPPARLTRRLLAVTATAALVAGTGTALTVPPAQAAPAVPQAAKAHPTITLGQKDPAVPYLKRRFDVPNRTHTYGKAIAARVARFEAGQGMRSDGGKVTSATWRALDVPYSAKAARARAERRDAGTPGTQAFSRAVLREAGRHAGKPYAYGGNGPGSFDCSGFTRFVYAKQGIQLPRTAAQQRGATTRISRSQLRPGDLVFVHRGGSVSHAAIYAGRGMWWEATRPGKPLGKNSAWTSAVSYGRA
jgi:peptidoglycan DL-endopeptidase CwlO